MPGVIDHHQVAGAVHPFAAPSEGIRRKALCGKSVASQIAARQAGPGQVELAGCARRHRTQPRVEHEQSHAAHREAEGHRQAGHHRPRRGRGDRGLGRAVHIVDAVARRPGLHQLGRARLAADDDDLEIVEIVVGHRVECGGGDERVGDPLAAQHIREFGTAVDTRRDDHHGGARREAEQHLQHRGVEARRREVQCACRFRDAEQVHLLPRERGDTPVGHHDGLGLAGRPRGVDEIGGMADAQRVVPLGVGDRRRRVFGQFARQRVRAEHQPVQ